MAGQTLNTPLDSPQLQPHKPTGKPLEGRGDERVRVRIPVCLTSALDPYAPEVAVTENVSSGGLRVLGKRRRALGESHLIVATPSSAPPVFGRVIYCYARSGGGFAVGFKLQRIRDKWWTIG